MSRLFWVPTGVVGLCLAATLTTALWTERTSKSRVEDAFHSVTEDNKSALQKRLTDYAQSLNAASGLITASDAVVQQDWANFVTALNIDENLPGINGIGWIVPVEPGQRQEFLRQAEADGIEGMKIHPETATESTFVIKYIEPLAPNIQARGLNIAFEEGRRTTAIRARETGLPHLTPRILLVQDAAKTPGFLLLHPHYDRTVATADGRGAFQGWVYAPFIGSRTLRNLSPAQSKFFSLSVYDGAQADQDLLIYSTLANPAEAIDSDWTRSASISLLGREWLLVWNSTPAFDAAQQYHYATFFVAGSGLLLTALLGALVTVLMHREHAVRRLVGVRTRQLDANEQQNRSIIDHAMMAILVIDANDVILSANPMTGQMFGQDETHLIGQPLQRLLGRQTGGQGQLPRQIVSRTAQGQRLFLDVRMSTWQSSANEKLATVMLLDVTEEQIGAERLAIAEERWNAVLVGADIGVFDIDLRTGKSIVSDTWKRLMGVPPTDPVTDPQAVFLKRIHPDDLPALQAADRDCISGQSDRSIAQYRISFGDGHWRWMRSDATVAERDSDGRAVRFLGVQTDITELHDAREKLEASELQFRTVLNNAPVGMAMCAANGGFIGVNAAMVKLTGHSEDTLSTSKLHHIMVREDFKHLLSEVRDLQARKINAIEGEYRLIDSNGDELWTLASIAWTLDPASDDHIFILQFQDIREIKKVERMKTEFVSTVSHELRTPLTSIKGALALLMGQFRSDLPMAASRLMNIAQNNTDRLIELVNDILDMEKIASGQLEFQFTTENIADLVRDTATQMSPFAAQHKVTLKVETSTPPPLGDVDKGRFQQVVANLVSNAAKYSYDDTVVDIRIQRRNGEFRVRVTNQGPGVPEAFRHKLFQPFQQADSSDTRSNGGTGLGLNITKLIVERMGGRIGYRSEPEGETSFWVVLPETSSSRKADIVSLHGSYDASQAPVRILHLEDDVDFAEVLADSFGKLADITPAATLAEARKAIRLRKFELIIIDWDLPDGNGMELLETLEARGIDVPVIGLSAFESGARNDRITTELVKSRSELSKVVAKVLQVANRQRGIDRAGRNAS
ncbi:CHASE domain-containing protein [Sulfitobacter sabulilitoris]|uniref:histidine kinase n=1 Tax=Sulfitobacter sabulilitoris TaxID=2562655 RepID=A0A5S3PJP3_9RHOB|nr:CHASE domain-containing protein [Sulfitobacter sabulilitoris]TMM54634.1 PAS domain S-box protein [Sulfitobacter sabulilitoris]